MRRQLRSPFPRRTAVERLHLLGTGWAEVVLRRHGDAFVDSARVVPRRALIEFAGPPRVHLPHSKARPEPEAGAGWPVQVALRGQIGIHIFKKAIGQLYAVEVDLPAATTGVPGRYDFNRVVDGVGQVELRDGREEGAVGPPTSHRLADARFDVTVLAELRRLNTLAGQESPPGGHAIPSPLRMLSARLDRSGGWRAYSRNCYRVKEVPREPELCEMRIRQGNSMGNSNARQNPDDSDYNSDDSPIQFDYEIRLVDGERGRRLAVEQAYAILEVLEWFGRQTPPPTQ